MKVWKRIVVTLPLIGMLTQFNHIYANGCKQLFTVQLLDRTTPLIGYSIDVDGMHYHTDAHGIIHVEASCTSEHHILIQEDGYYKVDTSWQYVQLDTLKIFLTPKAESLDDVEIAGHKLPVSTNNSVQLLTADEIRQYQGKSLAAMLSQLTGVSSLQSGNNIAKPVIHGMHSNRLLILNNGVRQEGQQWGYEHAPEIDPYLFDEIAVIKGAEAVQYGSDAVGGVIILNPAKIMLNHGAYGNIRTSMQTNGRGGSVAGQLSTGISQIPGLGLMAQGSIRQLGNGHTANYYLNNTATSDYNYSAMLTYVKPHFQAGIFYSSSNARLGILQAAHIGSLNDLQRIIEAGRPFEADSFSYKINAPSQRIRHDLWKFNMHTHIHDYLHVNVIYAFQRNQREEYDRRRGGRTALPALDIAIRTHTIDANASHIKGDWSWKLGIQGSLQQNESDPNTLTIPLIPDFIKRGAGVYLISKRNIGVHQLEAGARLDYQYLNALGYDRHMNLYGGEHNFWNHAFQLGWQYNPSALWQIKSNIGTAFRPPSVNELYSTGLHHGAAQMEYGDPNLSAEQSVKWMTTIRHRHGTKPLNVSMEIYFHHFMNYIYLGTTGSYYATITGAYPELQYRETAANIYGVDVDADYTWYDALKYEVKASLIYATDIRTNAYLPMMPTHQWKHSLSYQWDRVGPFKTVKPSFTHQYVAEQHRYTPNSDIAAPPPAYHVLGAGLQAKCNVASNPLFINIGIQNLTNALYKDYLNRYRYFAHDLGRNIYLNINYHF